MSESKNHRQLREFVEKKLHQNGFEFNSSHSSESEKRGPALYIENPNKPEFSKSELQITQPDIVVKSDEETIEIIEIEDSAKRPKYILGDVYTVLHSNFMNDEVEGMIELPKVKGIYVIIAREIPEKGHKEQQYEHLISSFNDLNNVETSFKIF